MIYSKTLPQGGVFLMGKRHIHNIHKTCIFITMQKAFLLIIIKRLEKKPVLW